MIQQVLEELEQLGWPKKDLFGPQMALEETISNAIRHGNHEDPNKQVDIEVKMGPQYFWARVRDEGSGFQQEKVGPSLALQDVRGMKQ